uniref:Uncharacterized protein n=1 Tax=Marseillevirus LCMAC103 TaxID=2506604 RepID=A0A481YWH4_9VIRU|nr:MAG: hypothetical protein LCMAC103_02520 [Marseillevirus LCMAC103]
MGCDFYEVVYIYAKWKTAGGDVDSLGEEYWRTRRYFAEPCDFDPDEDSDDELDKHGQRELDEIDNRPDKILYDAGEWKIGSKTRIREYGDVCSRLVPDGAVLLTVYKSWHSMKR